MAAHSSASPGAIRSVKQCSEQVTGIYQGFNSYSGGKGSQSHAPVFRYQYNGKKFHRQCASTYPLSLLEKRMKPGEEYTIYIDPKKPTNFLLQKRVGAGYILFFLFGILIIFVGFIRTDGINKKDSRFFSGCPFLFCYFWLVCTAQCHLSTALHLPESRHPASADSSLRVPRTRIRR